MSRPAPRLHIDRDLAAGKTLTLDGNPAHYLLHVLRLKPGASVKLFNGRDGEWACRVATAGRKTCDLEIGERTRAPEPPPPLILAFAPLKKTAMDFLIQKATELGVGHFQPVITERTETARLNRERLATQAREAAEQCERITVPEIAKPLAFDAFLAQWPADQPLWCGDETGRGELFADALQRAEQPSPGQSHGLLIGPEGGFTPSELASLDGLAFVSRVDLGPRILRAETAALAALTCWQALLGDWRRQQD